jgi:prephenate dehydrogenase
MRLRYNQAVIVGVGLIGGSLGMILRRKGLASSVVGVGRRIENLKTAVTVGSIDRYVVDSREAVKDADLVILATPVDTYERHLNEWASCLRPGAIVTDVGSVKGELVERSERQMPAGVHFVGAHPIAGKEKTGAAAASDDLFTGRRCILTPTKQTNAQALEQVQSLWQAAGAVVLTMDPYLHDKILGAVSHLPHVAAFALMNALVDIRTALPALDLAGHSGGGLRDTTRIAASSPEMWRDIFLWNSENVVACIRAYERSLGELKQLIQTGDGAGIEKMLERAKEEREKFPIRS